MDLKVQKRLAAQIFGCSPKKVIFDNNRLDDIKQAITKRDLRLLIGDGAISRKANSPLSKFRVRKLKTQKSKGRRKGPGSKKGKFDSRFHSKKTWMSNVRVQRAFLKLLLEKNIILRTAYRELYLKSKGGYFRSKRHIQLYLEEHDEMLSTANAVNAADKADKPTKAEKNAKTDKKPRAKTKKTEGDN